MNKVISGLFGIIGLAVAATTNVAAAAPALTDGAHVQTVQYAYGYNRPGFRPGFRPHYGYRRPHRFFHRPVFGRFHGRPHFGGGYRR